MKPIDHLMKLFLAWMFILLTACGGKSQNTKPVISVSIEPLKYLTERIVGDDFEINVLVPSGASPETYEPTASQMVKVANSKAYINIGLIDFERNLYGNIKANNPEVNIINLDKGVSLILEGHDDHAHGTGGHSHGIDPHIWSSPQCVRKMVNTLYFSLVQMYPDSVKYANNYNLLMIDLNLLEYDLDRIFSEEDVKKTFIIYHPALSYLARDYGLTQIAVEDEGKEPSASHIRDVIDIARRENITKIFYQKQFSRSTVEAISKELGIEAVEIDPLAWNILDNTFNMCRLITE